MLAAKLSISQPECILRNVRQRAKQIKLGSGVRKDPAEISSCALSMRAIDCAHSFRPASQTQTCKRHNLSAATRTAADLGLRKVANTRTLLRLKLGLFVLAMVDTSDAVHPTPAGLTELSSADGLQMFRNSTPTDQFWLLGQEFVTQDSQDWCGLASASMVLNALPIPKPALKAFQGWVSHYLHSI